MKMKMPRLVAEAFFCFGTYLVARLQLKDMGVPILSFT